MHDSKNCAEKVAILCKQSTPNNVTTPNYVSSPLISDVVMLEVCKKVAKGV